MTEPLTIYECASGHVQPRAYEPGRAPFPCYRSHCDEQAREVRVFREEDVRPLYEGFAHIVSEWRYLIDDEHSDTSHPALDAFPAPEDWR